MVIAGRGRLPFAAAISGKRGDGLDDVAHATAPSSRVSTARSAAPRVRQNVVDQPGSAFSARPRAACITPLGDTLPDRQRCRPGCSEVPIPLSSRRADPASDLRNATAARSAPVRPAPLAYAVSPTEWKAARASTRGAAVRLAARGAASCAADAGRQQPPGPAGPPRPASGPRRTRSANRRRSRCR